MIQAPSAASHRRYRKAAASAPDARFTVPVVTLMRCLLIGLSSFAHPFPPFPQSDADEKAREAAALWGGRGADSPSISAQTASRVLRTIRGYGFAYSVMRTVTAAAPGEIMAGGDSLKL